jgi:hypothetical protein
MGWNMKLDLETCTAEDIISKAVETADRAAIAENDRSVTYPYKSGILQHYIFELVNLRDRLKERGTA